MEIRKRGLTFNDVLLVPKRTSLNSRSEADLKTRFTRNIRLNIPLVSSNMATVTENKMAIAMAREGGLGVIHQFCSIQEQVKEVKKVKKSTSYIIENPVCISPDLTVAEAIVVMNQEDVTSLLIKTGGDLVGIFTRRDYLFESNLNRRVSEVMTSRSDLVSARYGISLEEAKGLLHKHRIEKLPLIGEDGDIRGLMTTQDIAKLEYWKNAARDKKGRLLVAGAVGVKDTLERARALIDAGVDCLLLDVAHAHSDFVINRLKELKSSFNVDVMVGTIATAEAARDLIEAGADGLEVGIGTSPICTTRIISGAGVPQLTAVMDVAKVAREFNVPVCANGGMKTPGDVTKALAAGAETILSGTFFAGTDEAPGRILMKEGKRYKKYIGSASYESGHNRREKENGREIKERIDLFVEGVSNLVDYKGPVEEMIVGLVKGVKSGFSYCGASNLKEMQDKAEFIEITSAGFVESGTQGKRLSE